MITLSFMTQQINGTVNKVVNYNILNDTYEYTT